MDTVEISIATLHAICQYLTIVFNFDKENKHIAPIFSNDEKWCFAILDSDNKILKKVDEIDDISDINDMKKYFL